MRRIALLAATALAVAPGASAQDAWVRRSPLQARHSGSFERRDLDESSGIAVSRRTPGLIWTVEDSENAPLLIATETLGRDLGAWSVPGARHGDWEAVRVGPCGARTCVYIADTGDNATRRGTVTIYRVREPAPGVDAANAATAAPEAITFRYPGGPRDVEAMIVTPTADILLISKVRSGAAIAYRIPASAWVRRRRVVAEELGPIGLPGRGESFDRVTDAALAPDGRRVLVLTYANVYFFHLEGRRLRPATPPVACGVLGLQAGAEGADWLSDDEIVIGGESAFGMRGGLSIVKCPER